MKTAAEKKASKKTTRHRLRIQPVKTHVIEFTPEQLAHGIQRLTRVCEFVEMQEKREAERTALGHAIPGDVAQASLTSGLSIARQTEPAPGPVQGIEEKAGVLAGYSKSLAERAEEIVYRLHGGAAPKLNGENLPSQGPIKDNLSAVFTNLDRIGDALSRINEYIGG